MPPEPKSWPSRHTPKISPTLLLSISMPSRFDLREASGLGGGLVVLLEQSVNLHSLAEDVRIQFPPLAIPPVERIPPFDARQHWSRHRQRGPEVSQFLPQAAALDRGRCQAAIQLGQRVGRHRFDPLQ